MIWLLRAKQMFLKCFYDNSINIVGILAPGREFFSAKNGKLSLIFRQ